MIFNTPSACGEVIPFINAAQFDLIRLWSHVQTEGLFVVGDDDQIIYSWRGGSPEFIRGLKRSFADKANDNDTQEAMKLLEKDHHYHYDWT